MAFFSFFTLSVFSSFSSCQPPQNLSLRMYSVFFSLTFSFVWVLSSLKKVLQRLLYLQPSQLALQVNLQVNLSEFPTGRIKFDWGWFSCSKSLFELLCNIAEALLKLSWHIIFPRILTTGARPFTSRTKEKEDGGLSSTLGWASQAWKTQILWNKISILFKKCTNFTGK